jgi:hypothetical protein
MSTGKFQTGERSRLPAGGVGKLQELAARRKVEAAERELAEAERALAAAEAGTPAKGRRGKSRASEGRRTNRPLTGRASAMAVLLFFCSTVQLCVASVYMGCYTILLTSLSTEFHISCCSVACPCFHHAHTVHLQIALHVWPIC